MAAAIWSLFRGVFSWGAWGGGAWAVGGGGEQGEGRRMRSPGGRRSPTAPRPRGLTSSDLSGLGEEGQRQGGDGQVPGPPSRLPPGGPPLHLRAPHSPPGARPATHQIATAHRLRVPSQVAQGCLLHSHWGGSREQKKKIKIKIKKKIKGLFLFKLDGFLLPSCPSAPLFSLSLGPRRPGPSDPSSAGPCLQTEGG